MGICQLVYLSLALTALASSVNCAGFQVKYVIKGVPSDAAGQLLTEAEVRISAFQIQISVIDPFFCRLQENPKWIMLGQLHRMMFIP
jgi:hypothetical protein